MPRSLPPREVISMWRAAAGGLGPRESVRACRNVSRVANALWRVLGPECRDFAVVRGVAAGWAQVLGRQCKRMADPSPIKVASVFVGRKSGTRYQLNRRSAWRGEESKSERRRGYRIVRVKMDAADLYGRWSMVMDSGSITDLSQWRC